MKCGGIQGTLLAVRFALFSWECDQLLGFPTLVNSGLYCSFLNLKSIYNFLTDYEKKV